jgi:hypothetical protein
MGTPLPPVAGAGTGFELAGNLGIGAPLNTLKTAVSAARLRVAGGNRPRAANVLYPPNRPRTLARVCAATPGNSQG